MRVCMAYVGGLAPRKGGGVASAINNIVKHTAGKIDYLLLTVYDQAEQADLRYLYPSNVQIEYVEAGSNFPANVMHYLGKSVDDVDILHFHDFPLLGRDFPLAVKAYVKKTDLIYSHHIGLEEVVNIDSKFGELGRLMLGYYHLALNRFGRMWKRVVANSCYTANQDLGRFRALRNKICVIRNGVDVDQVRMTGSIELEGEPSILFVGRLFYRKGIDMLLMAFHRLLSQGVKANPKLHIVGSGLLEESCREYVVRHGLKERVRFWGPVSESLKFRIMKGADIIVVPSRYEPFGIVVIEGMAAGKPIIATRVGGIPEFFGQMINGILVSPSSNQIASAMKTLCEDMQLAEKYGRNNERDAMLFDWKKVAPSYVSLYDSVQSCHAVC